MCPQELTHLDENGAARMVDVGDKPVTERIAIASCEVHLKRETLDLIQKGLMKKGDVIAVARIAGIQAAKRTSDLIPLCHPIPIDQIIVNLSLDETLPGVRIKAEVKTNAKTGAEMEALMAVSVAALTVYDMVKAVEKTCHIENTHLMEKHGGHSGDVVNG